MECDFQNLNSNYYIVHFLLIFSRYFFAYTFYIGTYTPCRFYTSPKVRYRPNQVNGQQPHRSGNGGGGGGSGQSTSSSTVAMSNGRASSEDSTEHLGFIFNLLVSILDSVIAALSAAASGNSGEEGGGGKDKSKEGHANTS